MPARPVAVALALVLAVAAVVVVQDRRGGSAHTPLFDAAAAAGTVTTRVPTTTTTEAPTTTDAPVETTAPTTTTAAPPPAPEPVAEAAAASVRDVTVYSGLGAWVDVYDWSETFNRYDEHRIGLADVDQMAAAGIQTLYIQTSKWDSPTDVLEPHRLLPIVQRAKDRGMAVVAWYLPTFEDPATDMHRLMEASRIPGVDGLGVDIESLKVADVDERNRRLLEISANLREALPDVPLGAIAYPPVMKDVINPNLWPRFPWVALKPHYDVWLPMSYHTYRRVDSGYRDAYRYTAENIDRLRAHLGDDILIHTIGGIADLMSPADVADMVRAAADRKVLGGSLYDWDTMTPDLWDPLQPLRNPAR